MRLKQGFGAGVLAVLALLGTGRPLEAISLSNRVLVVTANTADSQDVADYYMTSRVFRRPIAAP